LEDRRGKDDEVPRRVWEAVEIKAEKFVVAKVEGRSRKEMRKEERKKK